jgi:hypothetical protein
MLALKYADLEEALLLSNLSNRPTISFGATKFSALRRLEMF